MARPMSGKYVQDEMCEQLIDYVNTCMKKKKVPILKEVSTKLGWNYDYVMILQRKEGWEQLKQTISWLVDTKEYMLERLALDGKIDTRTAIFSLKQLGWKDQQVMDVQSSNESGLKITLVKA